jgi:protein-tyrosine phosphatase
VTKSILFLCSGNYYRSRFAEAVFNDAAGRRGIDWVATSAGLTQESFSGNPGAMSKHALAALTEKGIPVSDPPRPPRGVTLADLEGATRVIALKESEHRAMIASRFPSALHRVTFWTIHDVDVAPPAEVLPDLEQRVRDLVASLP